MCDINTSTPIRYRQLNLPNKLEKGCLQTVYLMAQGFTFLMPDISKTSNHVLIALKETSVCERIFTPYERRFTSYLLNNSNISWEERLLLALYNSIANKRMFL